MPDKTGSPEGNLGHRLVFSLGKRNLGFAKTTHRPWGWLLEKLKHPFEDPTYTQAQFVKLPRDVQNERKALPGFILGGPCTDGRRKNASIPYRTLLCLDIDDLTGEQYERWVENREGELWKYEFFMHETRSSTDTARRIRVMIPLRDKADFAQFHAVSRIMAEKFLDDPEESMDALDVVSFRQAQLMFLPSKSKGQPLDQIHNQGKLLEAEKTLKAWSKKTGLDWTEFSSLPRSDKRENKAPTEPGKKMEDPFEKQGIIGAFCRAYPIEDAIAKFLPDVYRPGDSSGSDIRYTYAPGSGSNGAVVYDDGRFLYSNHGTDPVSDTAVNSWDLVRIHLFGSEDEGVHSNTSPGNLPSYKAMVDLAESDDKVREELADNLVPMFDDLDDLDDADAEMLGAGGDDDLEDLLGTEDPESGDDDIADLLGPEKPKKAASREWVKELTVDKNGKLEKTKDNLRTIMSNDPRIAPCLAYNSMANAVWVSKPWGFKKMGLSQREIPEGGRRLVDSDATALSCALSAPKDRGGYATEFQEGDVQRLIDYAAERNWFNPVLRRIEAVKWDGKPRVATFWVDHLKVEDNAYHRETAEAWFTAAVARLYEPGHKFDNVPILVGAQGARKSSLAEMLALGYFREMAKDFHNQQKMVESTIGGWIIESPELSGFRLAEIEDVKRWFSARHDMVRLAYRRNPEEFKRQCVFIGTSNKEQFLRDTTGNRRFWPIILGTDVIDMDAVEADLMQIWAEARARFLVMRKDQPSGDLPFILRSEEARELAGEAQEGAREEVPSEVMAEGIAEWADRPVPASVAFGGDSVGFDADEGEPMFVRNLLSVNTLLDHEGEIPAIRGNARNMKLLGAALRAMQGWEPIGNVRRGGGRRSWFCRVGTDSNEEWIPEPKHAKNTLDCGVRDMLE